VFSGLVLSVSDLRMLVLERLLPLLTHKASVICTQERMHLTSRECFPELDPLWKMQMERLVGRRKSRCWSRIPQAAARQTPLARMFRRISRVSGKSMNV
jgi:hypothetical protein